MSFYVDYRNGISQYTGTSFYTPVKASESKSRVYKMNRLNAYYGSVQHFFKSVFNNSVNKEGFILDRVKHMEGQKALALVEKIFRHLRTEVKRMEKCILNFLIY